MDEWSDLEAECRYVILTLGSDAAHDENPDPHQILSLIAQLREARELVEAATHAARTEQDVVREVTELAKRLEAERDTLRAENEALRISLDAMTNQAVMASGRRASIVSDDAGALRAEVERLRAAIQEDAGTMPIFVLRDALDAFDDCDGVDRRDALEWLDRVEAARKVCG